MSYLLKTGLEILLKTGLEINKVRSIIKCDMFWVMFWKQDEKEIKLDLFIYLFIYLFIDVYTGHNLAVKDTICFIYNKIHWYH